MIDSPGPVPVGQRNASSGPHVPQSPSAEDTAIAASILRGGNPTWANWKRGQDYYQEGELLWLDADTLIRKLTNNQKCLDDFEHIFLGKGGNTGPLIITYNFDELVREMVECDLKAAERDALVRSHGFDAYNVRES